MCLAKCRISNALSMKLGLSLATRTNNNMSRNVEPVRY